MFVSLPSLNKYCFISTIIMTLQKYICLLKGFMIAPISVIFILPRRSAIVILPRRSIKLCVHVEA